MFPRPIIELQIFAFFTLLFIANTLTLFMLIYVDQMIVPESNIATIFMKLQ